MEPGTEMRTPSLGPACGARYTSLIPRDLAQRSHASRVVGSGSTIMLWLAYHTPVSRGHTVAVGAGWARDAAHHQLAKTSPGGDVRRIAALLLMAS